jgi:diguanylate cyclase (GGDEF)-like protein
VQIPAELRPGEQEDRGVRNGNGDGAVEPKLDRPQAKTPALPSQRSVRYFALAVLVLLQMLTVSAILFFQHLNGVRAHASHMQEILAGVIDEIEENAVGFLTPAQTATTLSQGLFHSGLLDWERPEELERYLLRQLEVVRGLASIYYADQQGRFLMVARRSGDPERAYYIKTIDFDNGVRRVRERWRNTNLRETLRTENPHDDYDPRVRRYYKKALAQKEVIWTDPYAFFTSRQIGITTAAPILDGQGNVEGVVAADIELGALSTFLAEQSVGAEGSTLIVNRQGEYVAHPIAERIVRNMDDGEVRMARFEEISDPIEEAAILAFADPGKLLNFGLLDPDRTLLRSFTVDGRQYHAIFRPFAQDAPWPWVIGVYVSEEDFIGPIRSSERSSMFLAVIISATITMLAFVFGRRLLQPVVALREEIDRDPLTGLHNRRRLFADGPRVVAEYRRAVSLIIIDIDRFKAVNDTYGHTIGDEVLIVVADRLKGAITKDDLLARYAGDEFVLVLPRVEPSVASRVAERLRLTVSSAPVKTALAEIVVTVSLGVASGSAQRPDFHSLLDEADRALRMAKRAGGDRAVLVAEGDEKLVTSANFAERPLGEERP